MSERCNAADPVVILGAGAWGTALAIALAPRRNVTLWGRNQQAMSAIAATRENDAYLPGASLPDNVAVTYDLDAALASADNALLIVATSVAGLRPTLAELRNHSISSLIWLCKGFEEGTRLLPHQVAREVLGSGIPVGALSGPSFAREVAQGLPCALTAASVDD